MIARSKRQDYLLTTLYAVYSPGNTGQYSHAGGKVRKRNWVKRHIFGSSVEYQRWEQSPLLLVVVLVIVGCVSYADGLPWWSISQVLATIIGEKQPTYWFWKLFEIDPSSPTWSRTQKTVSSAFKKKTARSLLFLSCITSLVLSQWAYWVIIYLLLTHKSATQRCRFDFINGLSYLLLFKLHLQGNLVQDVPWWYHLRSQDSEYLKL